jgi:2-succinyl-5-enolpyruvyl-6-hydroxy-3-cyclohexene-1-carboxylate synthase
MSVGGDTPEPATGGTSPARLAPSIAQARVLVDELARCGLRDAVIAPGSRSAPLALALYRDPRVRLHVRIDERSAGFLAVGLGAVARRPVALVCTSGTAAANLHPAVLEASAAHVPLIVLTADRPPELRQTGANQTVDQVKLFGSAVRFFAEVGVAERLPGQVAYWRSLACRAYATAAGSQVHAAAAPFPAAGPVHLNLPMREPLVPDHHGPDSHGKAAEWIEPLDGRPDGSAWTRVRPGQWPPPGGTGSGGDTSRSVPLGGSARPRPAGVETVLLATERGAVVVGADPVDPEAAIALAEACGWPILSEPTGNARRGPHAIATYPLLLADPDFAAKHQPALIVTVGKVGLSRSLLTWIHSAPRQILIDPHHDWADPTRGAEVVLDAVPCVAERRPPTAWLGSWRSADALAAGAVARVLDEEPGVTEPQVARDLAAQAPEGSLLFVASSKPIRDLELAMEPREGLTVVGNRGVNGIDGLVSSAIGAALAWQDQEGGHAYALLGDLAYLHDRNGLLLSSDDPQPDLTLVVVDNDGGGIFSLLPQAGVEGFERVFGTPHGIDLAADAVAAGVDVVQPGTRDDLLSALAPAKGLRVVYVRTDRLRSTDLQQRLAAAVLGGSRG